MKNKRRSQGPSRKQKDSVDAELDAREKAVEQRERENAVRLREARALIEHQLSEPGGLGLTAQQLHDALFDVPRRRRRGSEEEV